MWMKQEELRTRISWTMFSLTKDSLKIVNKAIIIIMNQQSAQVNSVDISLRKCQPQSSCSSSLSQIRQTCTVSMGRLRISWWCRFSFSLSTCSSSCTRRRGRNAGVMTNQNNSLIVWGMPHLEISWRMSSLHFSISSKFFGFSMETSFTSRCQPMRLT